MYVLDTDHVSLVDKGSGADALRMRSRLERVPKVDLTSSVVSYEEQTRCLRGTYGTSVRSPACRSRTGPSSDRVRQSRGCIISAG